MAVAVAGRYSSDSTPGNFPMQKVAMQKNRTNTTKKTKKKHKKKQRGPKKKKKKKKKKNQVKCDFHIN